MLVWLITKWEVATLASATVAEIGRDNSLFYVKNGLSCCFALFTAGKHSVD